MLDLDPTDDVLLIEGLDEALVGIALQGDVSIAVYDRDMVLAILMARDGLDEEDAYEIFLSEVSECSVGPGTPAFISFETVN